MSDTKLGNYLKTHRLRSGLSQREVALVIGCAGESITSRHERSHQLPPLRHALAYEALYQVPVSKLFAGLQELIQLEIEGELAKLEGHLQSRSGKGPQAVLVARKLEWLAERRGFEPQV